MCIFCCLLFLHLLMDIWAYIFWPSLECRPMLSLLLSTYLGVKSVSMVNFLISSQPAFKVDYIILNFQNSGLRVQLLYIFPALMWSVSYSWGLLEWYLIVVLICFPNKGWCWACFHVFSCHLRIFFKVLTFFFCIFVLKLVAWLSELYGSLFLMWIYV